MSIKAIYSLFDGAFSLRMLRDRFVLKLKRPLYIDGVIMNNMNLDIPAGRVPGKSSVNKYGSGPDCDSGVLSDIWSRNDITKVWIAPTQARIHALVSTVVTDADGDVGANRIRVYGLPAWDADEVSEEVIMTGTTPKNTINSYVIIHRMEVTSIGTAGVNLGRITATAAVDGSVTAEIPYNTAVSRGVGQTLMAIYGLPSTKTAYITKYYHSITNNVSANAETAVAVATDPIFRPAHFTVKHRLGMAYGGTSTHEHNFKPYYKITGPAIIKMSVIASANNVACSGGFDMILEEN